MKKIFIDDDEFGLLTEEELGAQDDLTVEMHMNPLLLRMQIRELQLREDKWKKYVDIITEELEETIVVASVHGWKSSRIRAGAEARLALGIKAKYEE